MPRAFRAAAGRHAVLLLGGLIAGIVGSLLPRALLANDGTEFFEKQVRPLLVEHCGKCHGETTQWADLRLDTRAGLLKGGENGPVVVPGKPDESRLIHAVRYSDDLQMPPDDPLTPEQVATLEKWVRLGAPWPDAPPSTLSDRERRHREHWAFQSVADVEPPKVAGTIATPVDRFLIRRLQAAGLSQSPMADRRTLLRRVTYDLTGLPPSPEEVEAFADDPDPDAYRKLVERLLASPHYGEQWGRHWLDVARYSDTKGYVYAREERFWVHAPVYRDWVVQAFNEDLPYDRFLLLQIAADQAAPDDPSAWAAMGFLTLGRRFLGVTHDIIDDRIDVVTRGTLGLTVACARCHDHKYDPIPTRDYYSLYGIFRNSTEELVPLSEPTEKSEAYQKFEEEWQKRLQKLRETTIAKREEAANRVRRRITDYLVAQTELAKYPEEGFDQILLADDIIPESIRHWAGFLARPERATDPVFILWHRLAALPAETFAEAAQEQIQQLSDSPGIRTNARLLAAMSPPPQSFREVAERYGKVFAEVAREWESLCEAAAKTEGMQPPEALPDPDAEELRQVLYASWSPCLVPDEAIVSTESFFASSVCTELWKLQGEVDRWLIGSSLAPPHAVRLVDRTSRQPARVFRRGNPKLRGEEVEPHFLTAIAGPEPVAFQQGSGRLELARAIIDPDNPLTARVWVNRIWQHHFGTGLVPTPSDFGTLTPPPSHPELLDWLARQLIESGWSTKHIHRLIVLSHGYQQTSVAPVNPELAQKALQVDPENRLLWRMSPRRLSFEEYRDTLLTVASRMDLTAGGRAANLFADSGKANRRRTIYGLVDRQFLPPTMRVFDFANPDLHTPQRSETTVPQQALFAMNHPLIAEHAKAIVTHVDGDRSAPPEELIRRLYRTIYQREPTREQLAQGTLFLQSEVIENAPPPREETLAWQYGYGELDYETHRLKGFAKLPHFTGSSWQGAEQWPGGGLGWLQITAEGGHTGNDLKHSVVRRWIAPRDGLYSIQSTAIHEATPGDGVRVYIISSRDGLLKTAKLHNQREELSLASLTLRQGDTLDFVVDLNNGLNSDQHLWSPVIRDVSQTAGSDAVPSQPSVWDARRDFSGPAPVRLTRAEQLAQVLLVSNETMFVD